MKILIVTCVYPPEPVVSATISKDLAEVMALNNIKVDIYKPKPSRPFGFNFAKNESKSIKNIKIFTSSSFISAKSNLLGRILESISFGLSSFFFILGKGKYDLIYVNSWPLFGQLGVVLGCVFRNTDYVLHVMDIYPESLSDKTKGKYINYLLKPFILLDNVIVKRAKKVIFISDLMQEHYLTNRNLKHHTTKVSQNYMDEELFIKKIVKQNVQGRLKLMYLGNIGPVSGLEFVLQSIKLFADSLVLTIAGSGSRKDYYKSFCERNSITNVEFLDVPEGAVHEVQSSADVLLLPMIGNTSNSSVPSKLPAYMFSGRPVLAMVNEKSDVARIIIDSNAGWVIPYGDFDELNFIISKILITEQVIIQKMGENAKKYANNHFGKSRVLQNLFQFIVY